MAFSVHDLPWTPTQSDLEAPQTLKPIKINGEYASLQECADTHYQLMKEDFMRPIRVGIERFRTHKDIHSRGLHFYFNVRIADIIFSDKILHRLQFDSSKITLDHWKYSGQLASGSLLLISCNDFESFVYATVVNRQVDLLTEGYVDVEFIPERDSVSHLLEASSGTFVMAESVAHYKSYCHVLSALKQAKICNRLQEYIIKCSQRLERPGYLTLRTVYNMSCIMKDERPCNFELLKPDKWPDKKVTCFNKAQYKAFQQALTKELAVIQGPSDTGKTFVCLKIIQTLLNNGKTFESPILVICKTSDALDDILEGVLEFCTSNIIRFGKKSKSSELEMLNFDSIKRKKEEGKEFSHILRHAYWENGQMLAKISEDIAECHHSLGSLETEIQSPEALVEHMNHFHKQSVKRGRWSTESLLNWLSGDEYNTFTPTFKAERMLHDLFKNTTFPMSEKEETKAKNLKQLKLQQRLALYKLWINKYRKQLSGKLAALLQEYRSVLDKIHQINKQKIAEILQSASVIGMTTTAAAKHSWELRTIKCKIVLVEDAAKVFESQIIAALDQWCKHLILIGDHQLGGPSSAVFQLMSEYGLSVSLFERLINNGIPYVFLNKQYKMCSNILKLMSCLYPKPISNVPNNATVQRQEDLFGVSKNVFFIDHNHKGNRCSQTGKEVHVCETDYIVAFCKYLLFQGHAPSAITILTTNVEQMLAIKTKIIGFKLSHHVLVTTVDRYKNRELDIILLSFIRSKEEIRDSFPVAVNQVSQALSKAKYGFFAIGDFESLKSQSKQWSDIINLANTSGAIGISFPVACDLTITHAEEFSLFMSYKKIERNKTISLKYDFSKSFTVKEIKAASFKIKYAYCLLKIQNMNKKKYNIPMKLDGTSITQNLTRQEKDRFKLDLACLLYLVVIAELEHSYKARGMLTEDQKMLINTWREKLSGTEINAEILDSADDFVEALMLSGIFLKKLYSQALMTAKTVDKINTIIFSKDSQMLCDILENRKIREMKPKSRPPLPAPRKRAGKAVHGRELFWILEEKLSVVEQKRTVTRS